MRLLTGLFFCVAAVAQTGGPVAVELSLVAPKAVYKTGEAIQFHLTFTAQQTGFTLNKTTTSPASPVDTLLVTPKQGAVRWLDDQNGGHPYSPDYALVQELAPGKAETIPLVLNAVYRFESPGRYALQVITKRLLNQNAVTTNTVSFDIQQMDQAEEARRAAMLEEQIRNAPDLETAKSYAEQLDWLAGDAAAKVKLSLFLHPKTFYPFGVDVSRGVWITGNRSLIVNGLEQAVSDPTVPTSSLLGSLVSLKRSLTQLPFEQLEDRYLTEIAGTFTSRSGKQLSEAAVTVCLRRAQRQETDSKGFLAAREALIANFSQVNDFSLDLLLSRYSKYFLDVRIAPALREFLVRQEDRVFSSTRANALRQLVKIASQDSRQALVVEVCRGNFSLSETERADIDTLPEADQCLNERLRNPEGRTLDWPSALVARFATVSIYDDVFVQYGKLQPFANKRAQGHLLAYLLRWNPQRALPLLESALPLSAPDLDGQVVSTLTQLYSPALAAFFRGRLFAGPPQQARTAAYQLSQHGPAEDRALIEDRLKKWRAAWAGRDIPTLEGLLEAELIGASLNGKNWSTPEDQARAGRASCISESCRKLMSLGR